MVVLPWVKKKNKSLRDIQEGDLTAEEIAELEQLFEETDLNKQALWEEWTN